MRKTERGKIIMTDKELILLARQGNEDALTDLIVKYTPLLRRVVAPFNIAGADRDDLLQEATLALIKAVKNYDDTKGQAFSTFLYGVARQRIIDTLRAAHAQSQLPLNGSVYIETLMQNPEGQKQLHLIEPKSNLLDVYIQEEEESSIRRAIEGCLTDRELQVLKEYLDGKSYIEIATTLKISSKTVDNTLARIKKKIRANKELFDV